MSFDLPATVTGIRLCKVTKADELVLCEPVQFVDGRQAVDTVLRRAQISGMVGPVGETGDFWADLIDDEYDIVGEVALDRKSYRAIKTRWARCRIERI